ncbi:MAG: hypothetical protein Q7S68_05005, partial [Deltaproteobacteria bacterium]|nr:hypothetical protein [Deltaproteobacteria bacterium]
NMRMAGRYGMETVMIRNLEVIDVKPEENILLLKGAIPGARENVVTLLSRNKDFAGRFKTEAPKVEETKPEAPNAEVKDEAKEIKA